MPTRDWLQATAERRLRDAERYAQVDDDLCMLCGARGPDKRNFLLRCFYALEEIAPEFIDLTAVDRATNPNLPPVEGGPFYYLRLCKGCRAAALGALQAAFALRRSLRGVPIDSDGEPPYDAEFDPERNIPVRVLGTTVWMNATEYAAYRQTQAQER